MPCTRLQMIVERETRAYFADHVALVALLVVISGLLTVLAR